MEASTVVGGTVIAAVKIGDQTPGAAVLLLAVSIGPAFLASPLVGARTKRVRRSAGLNRPDPAAG